MSSSFPVRCFLVILPAVMASLVVARDARSQVVEPNGVSVPATVAGSTETTLAQYFASKGEAIDAVADAATSPAVFLPLCDFQTTLVLSQSGAQAGLAWYNVPASPTATPVVHLIGTPPLALGQSITSADIRSDPGYADGLIGFALMKDLGSGYVPVYYSEYMRNVDCTMCTTPGYWKMALSYKSTNAANAYYMAWEDWEGASASSWPDDGDFNDKVFFITGVTCDGGGVACETGLPGVCAAGVTECQPGGTLTCKPQITASPEKCDNLDNDCNGQVDDGPGLCPGNQVCVQGQCIGPCSDSEFPCNPPLGCRNGYCVDLGCVGVTCAVGKLCQAGQCVGGCDGVVCPAGQDCQLGVCVDPCAGVSCPGAVCEHGACVTSCACRSCPAGQACASDGHCVDQGCQSKTCPTGQVCRTGACVDPCAGAACPGGGVCANGKCQPPSPITGSGTGTGGAAPTGGGTGSGGATGAGGRTGTGGIGTGGSLAVGGGAGGSSSGPHAVGGEVGCSCAVSTAWPGQATAALIALSFLAARSRSRRRR